MNRFVVRKLLPAYQSNEQLHTLGLKWRPEMQDLHRMADCDVLLCICELCCRWSCWLLSQQYCDREPGRFCTALSLCSLQAVIPASLDMFSVSRKNRTHHSSSGGDKSLPMHVYKGRSEGALPLNFCLMKWNLPLLRQEIVFWPVR